MFQNNRLCTLKARKSHKQTVFATAHKQTRVIHTVLKSRKPYVDHGTDHQKIMACGNAPRLISMMTDCGIECPAAGHAATQPA